MLYLLHEAPPEEQNFSMVMEMIAAAEVHEDDDNYQSLLDLSLIHISFLAGRWIQDDAIF